MKELTLKCMRYYRYVLHLECYKFPQLLIATLLIYYKIPMVTSTQFKTKKSKNIFTYAVITMYMQCRDLNMFNNIIKTFDND